VRDKVGKKNKMKNNAKQELATTQSKNNSKHKRAKHKTTQLEEK